MAAPPHVILSSNCLTHGFRIGESAFASVCDMLRGGSTRLIRATKIATALVLLSACAGSGVTTPRSDAATSQPIEIQWLGHAAFRIESSGGTTFLIDPFISKNPATPAELKDLSAYKPDFILVTHSHGDHLGDAIELARLHRAPIVSVSMPELFRKEELPESLMQTVNVGGSVRLGDAIVHVVPAMHGSEPSGRPVGFVIEFADGRSVYHQGDTWIFGDMALIEELYHPTIILMNAGGRAYNQSAEVGLMGVNRWFKPRFIIPMHYASMPAMSTEAEVRSAIGHDPRVRFMKPGEVTRF
jgi:L-ascorbate metabolism protein UlaG (beta-lactamase superfamily)